MKEYLISWIEKDATEESIYMPETDKEAEEYLAGLIAHNEKDVTLWVKVPYEVIVKLSKKSGEP